MVRFSSGDRYIMLKVLSFLLSFLFICSLTEYKNNTKSYGLNGEWLTISQLAQKHPDWLDKEEYISDFVEEAVYTVSDRYTKLFVAAICKVNLTAVSQDLQQDVCSLQYVCGKPYNLCYEEDDALENLIWGNIYILIDKNGLPQKNL